MKMKVASIGEWWAGLKKDSIHEGNYQSQQFWAMVMCSFGKQAKVGLRIWDLPNLKEIDDWYGSIYTIVIQHRVEKKYLDHLRKVKTNMMAMVKFVA